MAVLNKLMNRSGIDPDELYQCIAGHVSKAGSFGTGETRRGSHPGVTSTPGYWALASLADDELTAVKAARGILTR